MGEYAHQVMRGEIQEAHGFDIGEYDDDEKPKRYVKPVYKRIKCPHCECHPKVAGVVQHIRDKHGIELAARYAVERLAK